MPSGETRSMHVGPAHPLDTDAVMALCEQLHQESVYRSLPFDRRKVADYISRVTLDPANRCLFVARIAGHARGMLAGYLDEYVFCDGRVAYDTVFYVEKRQRGSLMAKLLITAFRDWAADRGAREVCLGVSSGINNDRVGRFYESLGFTCVGALYKQRLR